MDYSRARRSGKRTLWDKIWRDDNGNVVIWQFPSPFLFGWVIFTCLSLILSGTISDVFSWIGTVSLIIWSLLEIFQGVNYFRRALGVLILLYCIASIVNLFK